MNISDSERIAGLLELNGLTPVYKKDGEADLSAEALAQADLVIFNTCGIRQMAEDRAYGQIHNLRKNNPKIKIILTGCLANREDVQKRLKDKVDYFCEIKNIEAILHTIGSDCNYLKIIPKYSHEHTAQVPIMTGCNNFCSYCVVPYARGREVSRPASEIIAEIKTLIEKGCKEITLLGQNVNSYNYMTPLKALGASSLRHQVPSATTTFTTFPNLLQKIEKIPGNFWIRFMSSHPKDFSSELIETIAKSKKICEHIHLPLQAGSDKILTAMNRKYTAKHYFSLVRKIRSAFKKNKPGTPYSLTSDIIVGFPGETKKDFLETAESMKKIKYDLVYFGQFSPRPGTAAWKLKDNVSKAEKVRRERFLNEILAKTTYAKNKKYVGKILKVLIDSEKNGFYFGRTRSGKDVKIKTNQTNLIGTFVKVKITKANIWNLEGNL